VSFTTDAAHDFEEHHGQRDPDPTKPVALLFSVVTAASDAMR
jgi:hypothetical protein